MSRTRTLALLTAIVLLTGGLAKAGPPTLCHPLKLGDAASIPFGTGAFDRGSLAQTEVVARTVEVLNSSTEATVHQETLRRAYVYLGFGEQHNPRELNRLVTALKDRTLSAEAPAQPLENRKRALCWFDLSVLYRLISENHSSESSQARWPEVHRYMSKAVSLDPDNGALALCAALGNVLDVGADHQLRFLRYMKVALTQARQEGGLLEQNALMVLAEGVGGKIDRTSAATALAGVERALEKRKV